MRRLFLGLAAAMALAPSAFAALVVGAKAPDFTLPAALDGKEFTFRLADALKNGPVVVYFFPKAFTGGCSLEAHQFAAASDDFKALGASIIGVSRDDMATLDRFSTQACQSKFPVASDRDGSIVKAYRVPLGLIPLSNRTSFLIAQDGTITYVYSALAADKHVANTLAALHALKDAHKS